MLPAGGMMQCFKLTSVGLGDENKVAYSILSCLLLWEMLVRGVCEQRKRTKNVSFVTNLNAQPSCSQTPDP